ncbi:MAG: hypothetical protein QNJ92_16060 [Alphaproteobacteria bacterium]|nr:hypothetical protein [Alphaproteobacteria bacterium]
MSEDKACSMSEDLLARKGEAVPSAFGSDEADAFAFAFAARRVVSLLPSMLRMGGDESDLHEAEAEVSAEPAVAADGVDLSVDRPNAAAEPGPDRDRDAEIGPEHDHQDDEEEEEDEPWLPLPPAAEVNGEMNGVHAHPPSPELAATAEAAPAPIGESPWTTTGLVPSLKPALPLPSTYDPSHGPRGRVKFTFRIDAARHEAFKAAADQLGISRQKFLLRALDTHLCALGYGSFLPSREAREEAMLD